MYRKYVQILTNKATRSRWKRGHAENPCCINEQLDFMETELLLINTKPPKSCLKHRAAPWEDVAHGSPATDGAATQFKHVDWLLSDEWVFMQTKWRDQ